MNYEDYRNHICNCYERHVAGGTPHSLIKNKLRDVTRRLAKSRGFLVLEKEKRSTNLTEHHIYEIGEIFERWQWEKNSEQSILDSYESCYILLCNYRTHERIHEIFDFEGMNSSDRIRNIQEEFGNIVLYDK